MSIFTAVRNQKQTAGALHGAMQYVMDPRKTVDGEDGKAASSERNAKIKAYCGRYRGMRWMPDL